MAVSETLNCSYCARHNARWITDRTASVTHTNADRSTVTLRCSYKVLSAIKYDAHEISVALYITSVFLNCAIFYRLRFVAVHILEYRLWL